MSKLTKNIVSINPMSPSKHSFLADLEPLIACIYSK